MSDEKSTAPGKENPQNENQIDEFLYSPADDEVEQEVYQHNKEEKPGHTKINSLRISDTLRGRISEYEHSPETQTQFRHRIALIGAVELDSKRQPKAQSGAWPLLEAFYQHGRPHWLDPIKVIMPIRDIMFKMQAPPMADRGIFYVLTRVARAGISPAAFAMHIVLPRMGQDYDWRLWRARHIWILDSIADLLVELRTKSPWNTHYLGKTRVLTDIALCKYVGRPLSRLLGERISEQKGSLEEWARAWLNFTFSSPHFLTFLRRAILPCLYRLSGKIDPEQLAPMALIMARLEKKLGKRTDAIPPEGIKQLVLQSGFLQTLEDRIKLRVNDQVGYLLVIRELRAYLQLVEALSETHAGLSLLREICQLSLLSEPTFLAHAAKLVPAIRHGEGTMALRKHILALQKYPENKRDGFIAETKNSGGMHPSCAVTPPPSSGMRFPPPSSLALSCGMEPDVLQGIEFNKKAPAEYKDISAYFARKDPAYAKVLMEMGQALQTGRDADWDDSVIGMLTRASTEQLKLALHTCVSGFGARFTNPATLDIAAINKGLKPLLATSWPKIKYNFQVQDIPLVSGEIEPYPCDVMRTRIRKETPVNALKALTIPGPETDCAEALAELGKFYASVSRAVNTELSRAIEEENAALSPNSSGTEKPDPHKDPKVRELEKKQWAVNELFKALEDVPVNKSDPRRFTLAIFGVALFIPGNEKAAFSVLMAAAARYREHPLVAQAVEFLTNDADTSFLGIGHATLLEEVLDGICMLIRNDQALHQALYTPEQHFTTFIGEAADPFRLPLSITVLELAFRKAVLIPQLCVENTKWRDFASRILPKAQRGRNLVFMLSRGILDVFYGDMGSAVFSGSIDIMTNPDTMVVRLLDKDSGEVSGSALLVLSRKGIKSAGIGSFWQFFAINPASSITRYMGLTHMTRLYLGFRLMAEQLAVKSGFPAVLCGLGENNIISSNPAMALIARNFEQSAKSITVEDALCTAVLYPETKFRKALVIADPKKPATLKASALLRGQ